MAKINAILLVEDRLEVRTEITERILKQEPDVRVIAIDERNIGELTVDAGDTEETDLDGEIRSMETIIGDGIEMLAGDDEVALVVVDHDLSRLRSQISESAITAASHGLAIPVCRYHRMIGGQKFMASSWELNSSVFAVDVNASPTSDAFAMAVLNVMSGFQILKTAYKEVGQEARRNGAPAVLSSILGKSELADHFSLYSAGISFLNDPLIISRSTGEGEKEELAVELEKRIPYVLGYWLHNSILQYPGIILNEVATASHLDIHKEEFEKDEIRKCFDSARYDGPFSLHDDYWWRPDLDDLVEEAGGRDYLLQSCGIQDDVKHSVCKVSGESPAGFYDLFSGEAISREHSVGDLGWIAKGADLTRAEKEKYDELAPILNM